MRLRQYTSPSAPTCRMRAVFSLIVMPRSRSRSMPSRNCFIMSRSSTVPVLISSWSASVDLPWSMCAMMLKLRMRSTATCGHRGALLLEGFGRRDGVRAGGVVGAVQWQALRHSGGDECALHVSVECSSTTLFRTLYVRARLVCAHAQVGAAR